jgi:CRISPR system Cascade subunit CasD
MGTLLLRLCGPMQSWGTQSRFSHRDTNLEPSKSGVIGLLCASMGRSRDADISDMANLKMGVRVDWPGAMERDYHTALNIAKAGGGKPKECEPSNRFYLADACFLVALQGDSKLLVQLNQALISPVWQLYLGRKAFISGAPVFLKDGLRMDDDIDNALRNYPYLCQRRRNPPESLRLELQDENGEQVKIDQPLSFAQRRFGLRHLITAWVQYRDLPMAREDICICQS